MKCRMLFLLAGVLVSHITAAESPDIQIKERSEEVSPLSRFSEVLEITNLPTAEQENLISRIQTSYTDPIKRDPLVIMKSLSFIKAGYEQQFLALVKQLEQKLTQEELAHIAFLGEVLKKWCLVSPNTNLKKLIRSFPIEKREAFVNLSCRLACKDFIIPATAQVKEVFPDYLKNLDTVLKITWKKNEIAQEFKTFSKKELTTLQEFLKAGDLSRMDLTVFSETSRATLTKIGDFVKLIKGENTLKYFLNELSGLVEAQLKIAKT